MSELQPGLEKRLAHVKQMLSEAEEKAGRPQGCVKLLAVGKTFITCRSGSRRKKEASDTSHRGRHEPV